MDWKRAAALERPLMGCSRFLSHFSCVQINVRCASLVVTSSKWGTLHGRIVLSDDTPAYLLQHARARTQTYLHTDLYIFLSRNERPDTMPIDMSNGKGIKVLVCGAGGFIGVSTARNCSPFLDCVHARQYRYMPFSFPHHSYFIFVHISSNPLSHDGIRGRSHLTHALLSWARGCVHSIPCPVLSSCHTCTA